MKATKKHIVLLASLIGMPKNTNLAVVLNNVQKRGRVKSMLKKTAEFVILRYVATDGRSNFVKIRKAHRLRKV